MAQPTPHPVRCPACGQRALPFQTRCLHCNARLNEVVPAEPSAAGAVQAAAPADGKCPGCGKELAPAAVLCIDCGYDLRTGRKRATVHAGAEEGSDAEARPRKRKRHAPLPAGLATVRVGLGLHYARLVLTLLTFLALMGLVCYAAMTRAQVQDRGVAVGALATIAVGLLAALLGVVGSILCLWVGRASRARGFILASLVLDALTVAVAAWARAAALPDLLAWVPAFASWILFMLFLRRLALYLDRPGEADECMALITRGVALLVAVPLLLFLLAQVAILWGFLARNVSALFLLGAVSVLIVILQFIFLVKLFFSILGNIQTLRAAIASRLPTGGPKPEGREPADPGGG
jgi:hypothetical protein